MSPTADFYKAAETCIMQVLMDYKPKMLDNFGNVEFDIKSNATPVTDLDKELEFKLRQALIAFDSTIGLEGEELGKEGNEKTFWLIDPIDGTESFVRGIPFARNIVTLIDNGQPVFTLVYKTISDDLFIASEGKGAYKNGESISVSNRPLDRCWVDVSSKKFHYVSEIAEALSDKINGFKVIGDFTLAVEGKVDAMLMYKAGGGPWDYAPRALLFKEAGGRVTNIGSDSYDFRNNDSLMASPTVFDNIMDIVVGAKNAN